MATINCKSCGRTYNYRSSELCPKCGAFNRPPHRMRVGFDSSGSVELQTEKEFARNARAAGPDDVCFEEQARKVRSSDTLIDSETLDALGKQLNKWGGQLEKWWTENSEKNRYAAKDSPLRDRKKGKSSGSKAVAIIAAVSVLVSLLGSIMESCESNRVHIAPEPDYSIPTEEVAPAARYWSAETRKEILDTYAVSEEVGMGTVFEWHDMKLWLGSWELSGGSGDNFMVVSVNCGDAFPEDRLEDCFLLWVDWDGTEWVFNPTKFQNGALIFDYLHTDTMPEDTLCWLLFNDYDENNNWIGTTAVSLVEHDTYFSSALDASQDYASVEVWTEEGWKDLLSNYDVTEECSMGSGFMWQGSRVEVAGWEKTNSSMDISIIGDDLSKEALLDKCYLLWFDLGGEERIYNPDRYEDGTLIFNSIRDEVYDTSCIWLVLMEGYVLNTESNTMENLGTTAVRLN